MSLRLRARFEQAERRSARALEARLECGWAVARGTHPAHARDSAGAQAGSPFFELDPIPCKLPSACRWEAESRAAAWAALAPRPSLAEGATP